LNFVTSSSGTIVQYNNDQPAIRTIKADYPLTSFLSREEADLRIQEAKAWIDAQIIDEPLK
jgi:hypothetical protein